MAPIRNGHLSSDIVVFILAFCLFCGNCVCTQAWGINWWQSVLSEVSPRHLNHPLCRAVRDKFIRNICTGLQQRKCCAICIFCRLVWEHKQDQMMERFGLQDETIPSFRFASSFINAKWVCCVPSAPEWTRMRGWSEWKTRLCLTLFYFYISCLLTSESLNSKRLMWLSDTPLVAQFRTLREKERYVQILIFTSLIIWSKVILFVTFNISSPKAELSRVCFLLS